MSPPLERVGGRGPSERPLLRLVVLVLVAALLAVVKPWGGGAPAGSRPCRRRRPAVAAARRPHACRTDAEPDPGRSRRRPSASPRATGG